jgi:phage recombination protein Bet
MTALTTTDVGSRAIALQDDEIIPVLQSSLYPGAKPESIKLVLGYCRAAGLDPMQKPVHIVPMNVKKAGSSNDYEWRDVVMPGIGLYRTQAARTGELAGIDEPVFGPMIQKFGVEFPEFCKVTVYRTIGGQRVPFTACEFWVENYATKKRDTVEPNAMWTRRPRGQIAKCAEAQALRKAFPELGSQPPADETMIDPSDVIDGATGSPLQSAAGPVVARKPKAPAADVTDVEVQQRKADEVRSTYGDKEAENFEPNVPTKPPAQPVSAGPEGGATVGAGEIAYLKKKAASIEADLAEVAASLNMAGIVIEAGKLAKTDFDSIKAELMKRGA